VSGSSSVAAYVAIEPSARRKLTSGILNSCSHWRQPPHGEALIPIAAISPGPKPATTAATSALFSAQTPSGYAAFSTLTPSNSCPSCVRTTAPTL
jgi:hypothetical protein